MTALQILVSPKALPASPPCHLLFPLYYSAPCPPSSPSGASLPSVLPSPHVFMTPLSLPHPLPSLRLSLPLLTSINELTGDLYARGLYIRRMTVHAHALTYYFSPLPPPYPHLLAVPPPQTPPLQSFKLPSAPLPWYPPYRLLQWPKWIKATSGPGGCVRYPEFYALRA